jgi:hypothetical protein
MEAAIRVALDAEIEAEENRLKLMEPAGAEKKSGHTGGLCSGGTPRTTNLPSTAAEGKEDER